MKRGILHIRIDAEDEAMLDALAAHEERSVSDSARRAIRHAFEAAKLRLPTKKKAKP